MDALLDAREQAELSAAYAEHGAVVLRRLFEPATVAVRSIGSSIHPCVLTVTAFKSPRADWASQVNSDAAKKLSRFVIRK